MKELQHRYTGSYKYELLIYDQFYLHQSNPPLHLTCYHHIINYFIYFFCCIFWIYFDLYSHEICLHKVVTSRNLFILYSMVPKNMHLQIIASLADCVTLITRIRKPFYMGFNVLSQDCFSILSHGSLSTNCAL